MQSCRNSVNPNKGLSNSTHIPSFIMWWLYHQFTFLWPCIVTNFFIIKPTRCTNFSNLLRHENLHVSSSSSAHHQEFIHCTLSNGICHTGFKTAFEQDQDGTAVLSWSCSKDVHKPVLHKPMPSVQWINSWWWTEELPATCRFSCRSKFGKLAHLVGFIIKKFVTMHGHVCWKYYWNNADLRFSNPYRSS